MTQPWMKEAWSLVGQKEVNGPAANPIIIQMFADVGAPQITSDEMAWCGAAVGACLKSANVPIPSGYNALRARAYADIGQSIDVARVGAVAVFSRGTNPAYGHVGFVTGETSEHIMLLGGNQSNEMNVTPYPKSKLIALRWPQVAGDPEQSRTDAAATEVIRDTAKLVGSQAVVQSGTDEGLGWLDTISAKAANLQGSLEGLSGFLTFLAEKPWMIGILLLLFFGGRLARSGAMLRYFRLEDQNTGAHVNRAAEQPIALAEG